ncbi:MAG: UDP-N-acetylmuramoyl-L-alanine--D-glutamate ligase [Dehalococcoidia bacterium]|nr:UDP-N-acetylmuramoyl-L-alanine--D-glutamate ligase [Dehalococcoidia bacterium]
MTPVPNLQGARVTVVGLGIEGIDLVRYLSAEGARVTVSDARPPEALGDALAAIEAAAPVLSLGANRPEDLVTADAVFVSQGVPAELPALREARERGVPISSMTALFMDRCPAPLTGITGSSGKTTTTALLGAMLAEAGADYVVAGNIGVGMLSMLDRVRPETRVVVELSHTQLQSVGHSPHLACVTNVTPNHLDRFSWAEYVALKRRIFEYQGQGDCVVLNLDDEVCAGFATEAPAAVAMTSMHRDVPGDGAMLRGGAVVRRTGGEERAVLPRDEIRLRGEHNVANVLAAVALAAQLDLDDAAIAGAVRGFEGVAHRLQPVGMHGGAQYINDSIATTPERTLAGIRSFTETVVLLLGGREKHLPMGELAREAQQHCRAVVTFGEAADLFASAVREAATGGRPRVEQATGVEDAVRAASRLARPGDVVLFSPAGTSFDAYPNFEARGRAFVQAVQSLGAD